MRASLFVSVLLVSVALGCASSGRGAGTGGIGSGGLTGMGTGGASGGGGGGSPGPGQWIIDNTTSIRGFVPTVHGNPQVTTAPAGDALCFDGDDAIVLNVNPVEGLPAFTIEVLMRFDSVATAALNQPRYLHIETADASRVTMEGRVNETEWHLDTYLLSGTQSRTLIDATKVHPVGQWTWTALTYDAGQMRHFVDGVEDASGAVAIPTLGPGKMSLGVRQNLMYWFKGCIREVRVAGTALPAAELQRN